MAKVIDTTGPEWSSELPTERGVTYWMYVPRSTTRRKRGIRFGKGMYLVQCLGFIIPERPELGRKYDIAFSFSVYEQELPKRVRFAQVQDPPGCKR